MPKKPKKNCKPHKHHKSPTHPHYPGIPKKLDENRDYAFLDEEICIEAKVTVNPNVSIGEVTLECLESTIEPYSKYNKSHKECTVFVTQLIRVKIPVRFSATVEAEKNGVGCKLPAPHEPNDESC